MPTIELTQETYDKLLEQAQGCEIDLFIDSLLDWSETPWEKYVVPRPIRKYYDTEKYKITAAADRERTLTLDTQ